MKKEVDIFYETIKDKYPDLTKEEIKLICTAQFKLVKEVITSGNLEPVRIKSLGSFQVFPSTVKTMRKKYDIVKHRMSEQDYNRIITMINNYELQRES